MTLIELLVVIVLVTTLVTTAIPILSPGGDSRKIREASRSVNAMLSGAQVRAVDTGRPQGVAFKRLSADTRDPEDNGVCVEMYPVEVPPPYAGFDTSSRVMLCRRPWQIGLALQNYNVDNPTGQYAIDTTAVEYVVWFVAQVTDPSDPQPPNLPLGWRYDLVPDRFLKPGDQIEIGGMAYAFVAVGPNGEDQARGAEAALAGGGDSAYLAGSLGSSNSGQAVSYVVRPVGTRETNLAPAYASNGGVLPDAETISRLTDSPTLPAPYWTEPAPYKIYRQPAPASGEPVQLPAGTAIDLQASGFANGAPLYRPSGVWNTAASPPGPALVADPVLVMFSPEGQLSRVSLPNYGVQPAQQQETLATSSLSLLVGRRELIPAPESEVAPPTGYGTTAAETADEPLVLDVNGVVDDETADAWRENYNWLSLNSRWVVVGAQSGSVNTLPNTFVGWRDPEELDRDGDDAISLQEQLYAAREAVALRASEGGR